VNHFQLYINYTAATPQHIGQQAATWPAAAV